MLTLEKKKRQLGIHNLKLNLWEMNDIVVKPKKFRRRYGNTTISPKAWKNKLFYLNDQLRLDPGTLFCDTFTCLLSPPKGSVCWVWN